MASTPVPSSSAVQGRMSRQRRGDTQPELALRSALHARGLRFRLGRKVPGRPRRTMDIAFPRLKVAVFVNGCFWHACPQHASWPTSNGQWWREKLERNVERDADTDSLLESQGWIVVRVWEHDALTEAVDTVERALARARLHQDVGGGI